jgi:Holliday junction DNA helicase RuvB
MHPARLNCLDDMVGQESIKKRVRIAIRAALQRKEPLPHTLLTSSGGGLGKTTLAGILANERHVGIVAASGPGIQTVLDLRRVMIEIKEGWVLHIDEIHVMGRKAMEELLLVLEEGVIHVMCEGRLVPCKLPAFTLIGSTTRPSRLSEPLRQRFSLQFHFDFYTVEELTQISRGFSDHMAVPFDNEVCRAIAQRSLGIPRICRRLTERVRDIANACGMERATMVEFARAMELEEIDPIGLTPQHRLFLEKLQLAAPRPVSAGSMAKALGIEQATVTDVIEPPLVRLGLVIIGPGGRRITQDGRAHLKAITEGAQTVGIVKAIPAQSTVNNGDSKWNPSLN